MDLVCDPARLQVLERMTPAPLPVCALVLDQFVQWILTCIYAQEDRLKLFQAVSSAIPSQTIVDSVSTFEFRPLTALAEQLDGFRTSLESSAAANTELPALSGDMNEWEKDLSVLKGHSLHQLVDEAAARSWGKFEAWPDRTVVLLMACVRDNGCMGP